MRKRRTDPFGFGLDADWFNGMFGRSFGGFDDIFEQMQKMMNDVGPENENVRHYGFSMTMGPDGVPHVKEWGNNKAREPQLLSQRDCGGGGCGDGSCGSLGSDPDYVEAPGPKIPFPYDPNPNRPGPGPRRMGAGTPGPKRRAAGDLMYEIVETDQGLNVTIELPGVSKENIQLEIVDDRVLHLKVDSAKKKLDRVIQLPRNVDHDSINAKANNGILSVIFSIKKDEKKEATKIEIE